eukprot:jgi/Mesen1/1712/ME000138S00568
MGGGKMAITPGVSVQNMEIPRLTTMLRTFSAQGKSFDADTEFLHRKELVKEARRQKGGGGAKGVGHSTLARRLVPNWDSAPQSARETYERFLRAAAELLDGESSSEELMEQELALVFGPLASDAALHKAAELAVQLKQVQATLLASTSSSSSTTTTNTPSLSASPAFAGSNGVRANSRGGKASPTYEFGTDFEFYAPGTGRRERKSGAGVGDKEVNWWEDDDEATWQLLETAGGNGAALAEGLNAGSSSHSAPFVAQQGPGEAGGEGKKDLRWLQDMCQLAASLGGGAQFSGDELAVSVFRVLDSESSGDEIAGDLFDLIGDAGFDLIQDLLQHRAELVQSGRAALAALKEEKAASAGVHSKAPRHGSQVSVQTESEKLMEKLKKKEDKRMARARASSSASAGAGTAMDSDLELLQGWGGFASLVAAAESKKAGVVESLVGMGDEHLGLRALPAGTKRKTFKGYEEVHVPPMPTASLRPDERLIKIAELDEFAQLPFEGYKALNRIQSRIFPTAYNSNENILVCAPTGAGKTNIAMIAVLHEVKQHMQYGVLQKNEFKVVYALAAEMAGAFSRRLAPLGITVKELTGDMQLTKRELEETQMIVTTPEKWDVITRKSSDVAMAALVRLLIIDEVHLLNDDRGPVIETLVARTLRQVEATQSMIRIVGLSATLPNYKEVAQFLRVNVDTGLFFFDASYRPVPLAQQYIGVSEHNFAARNTLMHEICYSKVLEAVKRGQQAMVFVHSRKDTVKTARILVEIAQKHAESGLFDCADHPMFGLMKKDVAKSRNRELAELFDSGLGIHHAGMLRSDRTLTERLFSEGLLKVLVCTATLAWGVNLPAHMVVIKIFGRAGRPQFDTSGEGVIITTHNKLAHYLRLLTHQLPIESQFVAMLKDNLNAEVVLGTVTNVREACAWLGYTYLYVRMQANPLAYGMTWEDVAMDPGLVVRRKGLITDAARSLDKAKMMRFDEKSGNLYVTELGRVASHFYIQYSSVETYNEMLKRHMNDAEIINLVAHSSEFENISVREEEQPELLTLRQKYCPLEVKGGIEDKFGKINVLIQVYLSRGFLDGFSLIADSSYISASLGRIMRALFEICLRRGWCSMAALFLEYCKAVDRRVWPHQHPLRQFDSLLSPEILYKLENRGATMERLYDMDEKEIGALIRHPHGGKVVYQCVENYPRVQLSARISPITRSVLQVVVTIVPEFVWKDRIHGAAERWWLWVEDSDNEHIYHSEYFTLTRKIMQEGTHSLSFSIPIFEPLPAQYYVRCVSDTWLQAECVHTISFKHLILPERHPAHTELLNLQPLPVSALGNATYEELYSGRFSHFNPIQTQAFHTLYHTDHNVLLGAPTGSGKTISAELAIMRLFSAHPGMKVIYIAPLKALVRERMSDWGKNLVPRLGKTLVELTGDFTPDLRALLAADIIIATPEKWDGISRNWHNRTYAQKVGLMVLDEIHLLGADRGPILEVIVSRMRYISAQTSQPIRFVGLSTALANARDLADWMGIDTVGLYNFKPSVRPVPLEVHIQGHPGRFYCPRMNAMNKPTYAAITTHSPRKPVLVFVSSRRQTRLTALDLIQHAAADEKPKQFVGTSEEEMEMLLAQVHSPELKHTLPFGIGLHHAGLVERDRTLCEELFANRKIQILVCTSTLAWGVNLPAHLVVVKGTEFYDGRSKSYVDMPITDILQMMGRAGRPQFDQEAKAVILVHDPKKSFYKKFLYEPFPVESSLVDQLHDHLNAEVAGGTIASVQDALDYLTWTYLYRRLLMNPSFYALEDTSSHAVSLFLSSLVTNTLQALEDASCLRVHEDGSVEPLVASSYYLHYTTMAFFSTNVGAHTSLEKLLHILCGAAEYDQLPVRHNEEKLNEELAKQLRWPVDSRTLDDPHTKANLLLQAHFTQMVLPISDYVTDTKSVLDQSIRILQACVDVAAHHGWLHPTLNTMHLMQMVLQGMWWDVDSPIRMLPHASDALLAALEQARVSTLPQLLQLPPDRLRQLLRPHLGDGRALADFLKAWNQLPRVSMTWRFMAASHNKEEPGGASGAVLEVLLGRRRSAREHSLRAYTPRFGRAKDEGWWLLVGSPDTQELHALKRVSFSDRLTTRLTLSANVLSHKQDMAIHLVSDCYLGLDQEHALEVPASLRPSKGLARDKRSGRQANGHLNSTEEGSIPSNAEEDAFFDATDEL